MKLNCYASFDRRTLKAGLARVIRIHIGVWKHGIYARRMALSIIWAEIQAIELGLKACIEKKFTNVIIETDSIKVVELINRGDNMTNSLYSLVVTYWEW